MSVKFLEKAAISAWRLTRRHMQRKRPTYGRKFCSSLVYLEG